MKSNPHAAGHIPFQGKNKKPWPFFQSNVRLITDGLDGLKGYTRSKTKYFSY